jgi:hypothetical protein
MKNTKIARIIAIAAFAMAHAMSMAQTTGSHNESSLSNTGTMSIIASVAQSLSNSGTMIIEILTGGNGW